MRIEVDFGEVKDPACKALLLATGLHEAVSGFPRVAVKRSDPRALKAAGFHYFH